MSDARPRVAVVDIGSNSVRLLLCEGIDRDGPRGERRSTVTGLRRGAAADGALADHSLGRLEDCLFGYGVATREFAPDRVIAVGTSAVRDAPNRDRVERIVRGAFGAGLTVLSGDEEARCAFAGALLGARGDGPVLVVDVGGASTELVRGDGAGPAAAVSLQLGAVRQTEAHLHADPPAPAELAALRDEAGAMVRDALARIGGPAPAVGVAGTVTTLAAIELGGYDPAVVHRHRLTRATVSRILGALAAMPVAERREVPGLEPARAEVIVAGAAIADAVMEEAGLDAMTVSERDLLDGVVLLAADPSSGLFRS